MAIESVVTPRQPQAQAASYVGLRPRRRANNNFTQPARVCTYIRVAFSGMSLLHIHEPIRVALVAI